MLTLNLVRLGLLSILAIVPIVPLISLQTKASAELTPVYSIRKTSAYTIDEKARALIIKAYRLDIDGQYEKALEQASAAYSMAQKSGDVIAESRSLFILGQIHFYYLKNYQKALEYLQASLKIIEKTNDFTYQVHVISAIGNTLSELGRTQESASNFQSALLLYQKHQQSDKPYDENTGLVPFDIDLLESYILYGLGNNYLKQGKIDQAFNSIHDSLISSRRFGNPWIEREALSSMGDILKTKKEIELAIVFYKESVQLTEKMRSNLSDDSSEAQKAYLKTVSSTYRNLADLLLAQGRVIEAQQVLELLKTQELRDYRRDTRSSNPPSQNAGLNPLEKPIPNALIDKIALGKTLKECEKSKCPQKPQLQTQVTQANQEFDNLIKRLKTALKQQEIQDPAQLQSQEFTRNAQNIILANPNVTTLLLYPLVLDDKLWLVWGTQAGKTGIVFDSQAIPVTRKELSTQVEKLRSLLANPYSNPKELQQVSQKLYQWLIAPIRPQLDKNNVQQIVFSLDRATRYIPMSTLYDGKQYLVENFTISTILTSQTDTTDKLSPNPQENSVLGLGLTQAQAGFNPLPAVKTELDSIIRQNTAQDTIGIFPGLEYLDQAFTESALRDNISDHRILHLATHGSFLTSNPDESFLLLGDGQKLKIPAIESMKNLAGTHLVVLSACETGKGGLNSEGLEVAGMGHYFLRSGAKSVMASLWLVNDPATAYLMEDFYRHLATGKSKPEALRQAQHNFLSNKIQLSDLQSRNRAGARSDIEGQLSPHSLTHPYYWAAFILIGNNR